MKLLYTIGCKWPISHDINTVKLLIFAGSYFWGQIKFLASSIAHLLMAYNVYMSMFALGVFASVEIRDVCRESQLSRAHSIRFLCEIEFLRNLTILQYTYISKVA